MYLKFYPVRLCLHRCFRVPPVFRSRDISVFGYPFLKLWVCPCMPFRTWGIPLFVLCFLSFQTFLSAVFICTAERGNIKSEISVPLKTSPHILVRGNTYWSVLVHDIYQYDYCPKIHTYICVYPGVLCLDFPYDIFAVNHIQPTAVIPINQQISDIVNALNRAFCTDRRCLHIVHFYKLHTSADGV